MLKINSKIVVIILSTLLFSMISIKPSYSQEIPSRLKICYHPAPPFAAPGLPNGGIITELTTTVFRKAGFETEVNYLPWARCVKLVSKGEIDVVYHIWEGVKKHKQLFDFMNNSSVDELSFITLETSDIRAYDKKALSGYSVALTEGGGYNKSLLEIPGVNYVFVDSDEEKAKMLLAERVDLIVADQVRVNFIINKHYANSAKKLRILSPNIRSDLASPGISKNHPWKDEIIDRYNRAYIDLCEQGFFKSLNIAHGIQIVQSDCKK
ncbi:MAG: transporter substrate-binding domain-containing protein [Alteromonadales bacterium]|nr:transporter substrate-binding domain-containing protein [Alteromonadales bacterium]